MANELILKRLPQVICIEATEASYPEFLATHIPFRKLIYKNALAGDDTGFEVDEETFYNDMFLKNQERHNFIIIKGNNGCGKSHLIRWVYEKFERYVKNNNISETILFISRFQNTLKGTLEQIINSGIFNEETQKEEVKKLMNASQSLNQEGIISSILLKFAQCCLNRGNVDKDEYDDDFLDGAYAFLVDRVIIDLLTKKGGPIDRIRARLNPEDKNTRQDEVEPVFYPEDFNIDVKILTEMERRGSAESAVEFGNELKSPLFGSEERSRFATFLNSNLDEVIQGYTQLTEDDMKDIFNKLRIELKKQGRNLTIFIEDITSFTGINKGLINVLATTHLGLNNDKLCRLSSIIGITNKYYENYFRTGIETRVTSIIEMDNAMLMTPEEIGEMGARYINAINLEPEVLKTWADSGANDAELPVFEENLKYKWSNIRLDNSKELPLFPFNLSALETMYKNLKKDKNPRKFLQGVIWNVLQKYASGPDKFPSSTQEFGGEFEIPVLGLSMQKDIIEKQAGSFKDRVMCLLLLWGQQNANRTGSGQDAAVGGLQKEVFDAFHLPFIPGISQDAGDEGKGSGKTTAVPGKTQGGAAGNADEKTDHVKVKPESQKKFDEIQFDLENWTGPKKASSARADQLLDYLISIIKTAIDWEAYGIPYFTVDLFINKNFLWVEGSISQNNKGFMIKRNEESRNALTAVAAWMHLGDYSWNFKGSVSYLDSLYKWIDSNKGDLLQLVRGPKGFENKWEMHKWAVISDIYLTALMGGLSGGETVEEMYLSIMRKREYSFADKGHSDAWRQFSQDLSGMKGVLDINHDIAIRYYSCTQGRMLNSKAFVMDALPMLEELSRIKDTGWDLDGLDLPDVNIDLNTRTNKVYSSLYIIQRLRKAISSLVKEEEGHISGIVAKLDKYIGKGHTRQDIVKCFMRTRDFINKLTHVYHKKFDTSKLNFILYKDLEEASNTVYEWEKNVRSALEGKTGFEKLCIFSKNSTEIILPYIEMLESLDSLILKLKQEYTAKMQGKPEIDVNTVKDEIKAEVEKINTKLSIISSRGGEEVKYA